LQQFCDVIKKRPTTYHTVQDNVKYLCINLVVTKCRHSRKVILHRSYIFIGGRDSVEGNATLYGWMVSASNIRGGDFFRTQPFRPLGSPSLLNYGYRSFPGVKKAGSGINYLPPCSTKVVNVWTIAVHICAVVACTVIDVPLFYIAINSVKKKIEERNK